jgi:hypothetical protein
MGFVDKEGHANNDFNARVARCVPATAERMVVGGGVFSEDGRGRTVTGPALGN